jgi:hypothetical protein
MSFATTELEQQLRQVNTAVAIITGGVLMGLLDAAYDSSIIQHIELTREPSLSFDIGLSPPNTVLYKAQAGNIIGIHGSSIGIMRSGIPKGVLTIYYTLTKIISQSCDHIIFPSLKSRIS